MQLYSIHQINLLNYARAKGLLKLTNLEFPKTTIYIDSSQYLETFEKLTTLSKDNYFGLHFGSYLNIEALGSVYEVSITASKMQQVFQMWSDYSQTNFPLIRFTTSLQKDHFILELSNTLPMNNQILDTIFTFVFRELTLMVGGNNFEIVLPYSNVNEYSKWYKNPITKGSKHCFVFKKSILDQEINRKRKSDLELILPRFLSLISDSKKKTNFSNSVRNMTLNMSNPELPNLQQVASQFAMTERTLQRKLKNESTTFRTLTNNIKKDLHFYLQQGTKIKTQDIAFILGYSSASAYLHAVQKWKDEPT